MKKNARLVIGLSIVVAIFDAVFKLIAIKRLPSEGVRFDFPLGFALHKNPGIAFDVPIPLPIIILLTLIIVYYLVKFAKKKWALSPLFSSFAIVIIAGAVGNMLDRILNGFTTDYIILFNRTAINLSDILIITGTILIIMYTDSKESR